jgi:hypothetical protein
MKFIYFSCNTLPMIKIFVQRNSLLRVEYNYYIKLMLLHKSTVVIVKSI